MENTTTTPTPNPVAPQPTSSVSNTRLLVLTGLLILATAFWFWSLNYRDTHHRMQGGHMMQNDQPMTPAYTEESDLNNEIDSSMETNSEIELKGIDEEF